MSGGDKGNAMQAKLRGNILSFPVKISTAIFRGTMVAIDAAGYLIQASDAAAMKFVGIAEESNTVAEAVADGTINCRVRRHGIFRMKANTTTLVTDVGKIAYTHTAQTASVDELVALVGVTTNDNAAGLIVRREPDTPGGSAYTLNYWMVDITPSPWSVTDIATHVALADQTAHTAAGVGPTINTETVTDPTITAAEFYGGLIACTFAGAVTFTLPTTGVAAGTVCRIVKSHATAGLFTITGGTMTGPQCVSNVFYGCQNEGDSVDILCVSANVYRVIAVSTAQSQTIDSDTALAITAAEYMTGMIACTYAGGASSALPATGITVGALCRIVKANATAGVITLTATTLVGPGCTDGTTANEFNGCPNNGDSLLIQNVGANSYRVVSVEQQVAINAVDTDTGISALEFISGYVTCGKGSAQAVTLPADSVPVGTKCVLKRLAHASAVTISATALDGGASSGDAHAACDAIGDSVIIICNAVDDYTVIAESTA